MSQKDQGPEVPSFIRGARRSTPIVTRRRSSIWWMLVVFLCLAAGFIGGIAGTCLMVPMIANQWLHRMEGAMTGEAGDKVRMSLSTGETEIIKDFKVDDGGLIWVLPTTPDSSESAESTTTAELVDPDPGELPDDEYLCESVEVVTMPVDGKVWQLAEEVNKTKPVDWKALRRIYPEELAKKLQPGEVIFIPTKRRSSEVAKITNGD